MGDALAMILSSPLIVTSYLITVLISVRSRGAEGIAGQGYIKIYIFTPRGSVKFRI